MKMEAASSYRSRVTPPESVHGLDTERFIKPVRHWFDGLRRTAGKDRIVDIPLQRSRFMVLQIGTGGVSPASILSGWQHGVITP